MKTYATIFVLAMLLGCGGGPTAQGPTGTPAPTPKPPAACTTPIKVGPIWASDPATGAVIQPVSVSPDGTPHYTFTAGQQVQFHAPVTGGC